MFTSIVKRLTPELSTPNKKYLPLCESNAVFWSLPTIKFTPVKLFIGVTLPEIGSIDAKTKGGNKDASL